MAEAKYYLTILPETRQLESGIKQAADKASRSLTLTPRIDTSGAARAGQNAGRELQSGIDSQARGGGIGRFLRTEGARSAGQAAGNEVNAGLQSADIGRGLGSQLGSNLTAGAATLGRNVGNLIATGIKATLIVGGTVAAAGLAGALHSGFSRLTAIDDAKFKLQGLGNAAEQVQSIMDNALAAVKGTAFGLDEAATTAASAVAAGIKPGQQLTDYLKLVGDTAAIAGTSLADMGAIFNRVQTSGKAFTGDLNQLADRGLPVFQWLQEEYDVSGAKLSKMVEKGKIDAATFQRVVAERIGGAAQNMGGSIRGQLSNLKAAYSRFGAELAGPIFAAVSPLTLAFTGAFDKITAAIKPYTEELTAIIGPWATELGAKITAWLDGGGIQKVIDFMGRFVEKVKELREGGAGDGLSSISEKLNQLGPTLEATGNIASAFWQALSAGGPEVLSSIVVPGMNVLASVLRFVADNASWAVPTLFALGLAWRGLSVAGTSLGPIVTAINSGFRIINTPVILAQNAAIRGQTAAMTQLTAALGGNTVAQGANSAAQTTNAATATRGRVATLASAVASRAAAAAQWLWNAALTANPIGLIVAGVVAAGVAIWAFFTKTETGRKLWDKIWTGVKTVAGGVWDWLKSTWTSVWETIGPTLTRIGQAASVGFSALGNAIRSVWQFIQPAIAAFGRFYAAVLRLQFNAVVAGFRLLGNVIGWLWRNIAVPAFSAIGTAASALWSVVGGIWDLFTASVRLVGEALEWFWQTVAVPAFEAVKGAVEAFWKFAQPIWDLLGGAFDKIGDRLNAVKDVFVNVFSKIKDVVKDAWDSVGGVFDKIGGFFGGLTGSINDAADWLGDLGGHAAGGTVGGSSLSGYATGGRISGPGTGTSDSILGFPAMVRVGNGEFIVNAQSTQRFLPLLEAINGGQLPGFKNGGLTPHSNEVKSNIMDMWPQITDIGGWRPEDGYGEHSTGNALDVMIPNWKTPEGMALGNAVASWAIKNGDALGLNWAIWRQRIYNPGDTVGRAMEDRGSPTQNHMDHVHLFMNKPVDPKLSLSGPSASAAVSSISSSSSSGSSSARGLSSGGSTSARGLSSGTGRGSYTPASNDELRSSADRVYDANTSAKQADQAVDDLRYDIQKAEKRLTELREEEEDTEDAEHDLAKKRRELEDAIEKQRRAHEKAGEAVEDDNELRTKGKFKEGKSNTDTSGGAADLGKTFVSGILESIGLDGSLFSNPLEWPTVKSLMAGINFAGGLLAGGDGEQQSGGGFSGGVAESTGLGGLFKALGTPDPAFDAQSGSPKLAPGEFNPAVANNGASVAGGAVDALSAFVPAVSTGQGAGAPPGPVDNSITINNPVGNMPQPWRDQVHAEQNARTRTTHLR
ncbi:tape measure protein [Mycobacterium phage Paola]|uniref:Tape measure protein n=1 Tax=Mycobacterium phage Paola TaxID=2094139 RepID=A0A2P1JZR7_9CAUD|nr:endolysin [Mycobacterium phage Paola]ASR85807.1 tape measure protein [Mycobacterium phage Guillsminger]AVO25810.1 tape measure protein [Mycobacterium phage Paola]